MSVLSIPKTTSKSGEFDLLKELGSILCFDKFALFIYNYRSKTIPNLKRI
jgi:hypothetical protein